MAGSNSPFETFASLYTIGGGTGGDPSDGSLNVSVKVDVWKFVISDGDDWAFQEERSQQEWKIL